MNVVFGPHADREYRDAFDFYEAVEPGLGEKFRLALWSAVGVIEVHPRIGRAVRPGIRSIQVRRFPYKIIYSEHAEELLIIAVAHGHREPEYWVDRD